MYRQDNRPRELCLVLGPKVLKVRVNLHRSNIAASSCSAVLGVFICAFVASWNTRKRCSECKLSRQRLGCWFFYADWFTFQVMFSLLVLRMFKRGLANLLDVPLLSAMMLGLQNYQAYRFPSTDNNFHLIQHATNSFNHFSGHKLLIRFGLFDAGRFHILLSYQLFLKIFNRTKKSVHQGCWLWLLDIHHSW